jgi:hypothetical protein
MKTKFIIIIIILGAAVAFFLRIGYLIAPGNYPASENYIINTSQINFLSKIDSFKSRNTRYNVPSLVNVYDSIRHSYNIYFYNYSKNQIIHIEDQRESKDKSVVHFIGINEGLTLGNWKMVNKDLTRDESEVIFKDFERNILSQLGISYKKE